MNHILNQAIQRFQAPSNKVYKYLIFKMLAVEIYESIRPEIQHEFSESSFGRVVDRTKDEYQHQKHYDLLSYYFVKHNPQLKYCGFSLMSPNCRRLSFLQMLRCIDIDKFYEYKQQIIEFYSLENIANRLSAQIDNEEQA